MMGPRMVFEKDNIDKKCAEGPAEGEKGKGARSPEEDTTNKTNEINNQESHVIDM